MNEISEGDVELVKKLYNCEAGSTTILNPPVALTASFTSSATVEPSTASTKSTISGTSTANTSTTHPTASVQACVFGTERGSLHYRTYPSPSSSSSSSLAAFSSSFSSASSLSPWLAT